ncbi:MAG: hypothetical protein KGJ89_04140 [Patescibacteria group bacterium]|nr:hypothetical protein [Patescibacteria group bacterium]MDE2015316.1 hypothetical protein [Patescibacteria group bacterium]MDE2227121.1 hypothetical protein [Patescibacteria group bacterium]
MSLAKKILLPILFTGIILSQYFYDAGRVNTKTAGLSLPPQFAEHLDLGLHSALASFLWLNTRMELPYLPNGYQSFFDGLNLINTLDPRFAEPYVFTEIVLPSTAYPQRISAAVAVGEKGVAQADKDWQIPFYLAAIYHLYLRDYTSSAKYFDLAAQMPGIPEVVKRFAINYGIIPDIRERTKNIWLAIYESTTDQGLKARAKAYVGHYNILDELQKAVYDYKELYGKYPTAISDLVDKKILKEIPPDPFGLEFFVYSGGVVGIRQLPGQGVVD